MATEITSTRRHRGLQTVAALTVMFFGAAQAHAQTPTPTPAPQTTSAAAQPTPVPDERTIDAGIPESVEGPASPQPVDTVAPPEPVAPLPPVDTVAPPEPPTVVGPPPPPAPAVQDGNLVVKDEEQANDLRRKGIGLMATGGVVIVAGVITSIAFTVRGTQYENLLVDTEEQFNRGNCSSKVNVKEGSKCDQLGKQVDKNREGIEFGDRATRAAGAAIAAGVLVTVVGGIVYRLGIKKLRSGDIARLRMQPAFGRNFNGLVLTGRF